LHLAAATPNFLLAEYPSSFRTSALANDLFRGMRPPEHGHMELPDGPGLGLVVDDEALKAHALDPYQPVT
jgi:L-alanine-DL-glutamate epimerase-like enolase superfamily enzyme